MTETNIVHAPGQLTATLCGEQLQPGETIGGNWMEATHTACRSVLAEIEAEADRESRERAIASYNPSPTADAALAFAVHRTSRTVDEEAMLREVVKADMAYLIGLEATPDELDTWIAEDLQDRYANAV